MFGQRLGGLDIAGLCGMFLGGAIHGIPDCDGWLYQRRGGAVRGAAPVPERGQGGVCQPRVLEPAARLVLEALGKQPLITADMHLGEGTGAGSHSAVGYGAGRLSKLRYSFAEGGIEPYTPQC